MKNWRFPTVILLLTILLLADFNVPAQQTRESAEVAEKTRIERLVGLAKVWGRVKYFHPYLAYREIDWDKALVETIPKVNAAKTPQEYTAAINSMLAVLEDKNTRANLPMEKVENQIATTTENKESVRLENGVLMIDGYGAATKIDGSFSILNGLIAKSKELVPKAKVILIDMRSPEHVGGSVPFWVEYFVQTIIPQMLDKNVSLSSVRYRIHNGYATQTDSGSGYYYSAMTTDSPKMIVGKNKSKTPQIVFLVNEDSLLMEMISGMQAEKLAFVIQDGASDKGNAAPTGALRLPENIVVSMRTAELVNSDGTIGFAADAFAPKGEALKMAQQSIAENKFVSKRQTTTQAFASQVSQKEKTYAEMEFPTAEYRLLSLFRFWNVMNYFNPYKDLLDEDWEDVLPKFIPKFEANKDAADYQMAVFELAAKAQDSHVYVRNAQQGQEKLGMFYPPFVANFVEGKSVVTSVLDETLDLKLGDVILNVNGETTRNYNENYARFYADSTPQAMQRTLHIRFLRGEKDTKVKLKVQSLNGKIREIEAMRTVKDDDPKRIDALYPKNKMPMIQVLPSGFGYVDLGRLPGAKVNEMFETIRDTPAVIFDMRGYPNGTAWTIAPRLATKQYPVAALFSRPLLQANNLGESSDYAFKQRLGSASGDIYKGKVVMLIDERAISQAEHTALFFEVATDVTFIGTPTRGANGDVTNTVLPGNLVVSFTGHNVRHADGRQLQRIGIQPTIRVEPTIKGKIEGRDEIFEVAVEYLRENIKK